DLYSVKPVAEKTLRAAAKATGGRFVVAEDHYPEGGLGAAVMEALALEPQPPRVAHCAVRGLPTSGTPAELLDVAGISAKHIAAAAKKLVKEG
nr:transketolase [Candidatus Dormibacteraeota bacterium]